MLSLRRLFSPSKPMRHFALLDATGRCCALRQCRECPSNGRWVEVHESRMTWLGSPLPASAHVMEHSAPARTGRALAA
ncbi:hypothetical protein [Pseudomonas sp. C11]|uniref:hypothetical protein n=1 Tax=Pseudomonas sp. C11 TaxID=3075550 RepID=UPI002B000396|nr:hypothetical protein [Pseudomonas sp. C11]